MLTDLRLQHFRSYTDDSFEFGEGVNIIVGPNASGKTNLLEAVLVICRGGSYRARDGELISFNEPWARLDSHMASGIERTVKLVLEPVPAKTYEIEGRAYKRLGLQNTVPVVLFEPNHLQMLHGSPDGRRSYLDDLLEQTAAGYGTLRRNYKRTLAQRNALLKKQSPASQFFPWDVRLSQLAGQIVRARAELVHTMGERLPDLYKNLSQTKTEVDIAYASQLPTGSYESRMLKKLQDSLELDQQRGFTATGPHREDLVITFDGHPASETASRGEARTTVLALKVIELELLAEARGITPLLLLDDVFSELDGVRRKALTEHLKNYQTFITTTDADVVVQHFTETCTIIALS
ncbi:MAG: replication and repair protein RecF [Candidatus Saccharibacteria bacterium]|nr:replication and repair protein RecF [Candidatus Saccharibacteria bacterium]